MRFMPRVLICTDEPVAATGLTVLFNASGDFFLAGVCDHTGRLHAAVDLHQPDLLLIDVKPINETELLQNIRECSGRTKIVLCLPDVATGLALPALSSGARGVLRRASPQGTLLRCLRSVHQGELWFEKALTDTLLPFRSLAPTAGENRLIALVAQGLNNREIAAALASAEGTVRASLSKLCRKLGVRDRYELCLFALKRSPVTPGPAPALVAGAIPVAPPAQTLRRR
jgi:DNA-binding NarL/FixJ family response regulator